MECLNSPVGLNPIEEFILKKIPKNAKVGVILGASDGRLSREIKKQISNTIKVYNVESRTPLHPYLQDQGSFGKLPWDLNWYEKIAEASKGFDFVILYNIHEYWDGKLETLHKILQLLKPKGFGFMSFYNSTAIYESSRHLPPINIGYDRLSNPLDVYPRMDLASWMLYLYDVGMQIDDVVGILDQRAHEFCKSGAKKEVTWKVKDLSVRVKDMGDAFILGAPILCFKFSAFNFKNPVWPKFSGILAQPGIIQTVLFPFADYFSDEYAEFRTSVEVLSYDGKKGVDPYLEFFVNQLADFKQVKNVLVVGCGWGVDLLGLRKLKPDWSITGIDRCAVDIAMSSTLMKENHIITQPFDPEKPLPFKDKVFDLVFSLKYFSGINPPLAKHLAKEMLRITKLGIAQFEDFRGAEVSMQLKSYDIPGIYQALGTKPIAYPVEMNGESTGMYILKVKK